MTIEERAKIATDNYQGIDDPCYEYYFTDGYNKGAADQHKIDINKACEWLIKNAINYADMSPLNSWSVGVLVYDLRKEMEEEL